jgi:hypothetical protein
MEDKKPTTWQIVIGSYTIILACLAFFLSSKFSQIDKTSETVNQILVENKGMKVQLENVEERIKSLQELISKKNNENFTVSNFQKSKNDLRFCLDSSRIHNINFIAQNSSSIRRFW